MEKFDSKPFCEGAVKVAMQFGKTFSYEPEDINDMEENLCEICHKYEATMVLDGKKVCQNCIQDEDDFDCPNDMEEILELYHNAYENKKITNEIAERIAFSLGVYLGQVMLESKLSEFGYEWRVDENQPCLASDDSNKMYPNSKVYKRIINGIEDSVKSFYDVAIVIAERGFPKK